VNLFRTRFAKGEAKEIIAPQKLSGNGCSWHRRCLVPKAKSTEMSKYISALFALWGFCLFAIACFLEVPLVLSFQGKNEKNFIPDILYRCQSDKLKLL